MSGKMVVIYKEPVDRQAFEAHYFDVHVPLAKGLPGLREYRVSRGAVGGRGGADVYFVATLVFDSLAAIREAFASDVGQACAADLRHFAPNAEASTMLLYDEESVL